ncbi:MAG: VCBS repeat-containing protein, partial [Opitutaceae bacterium]|nr:VCBS repeat-containing protein [Verrucomicrobiales bacterium]
MRLIDLVMTKNFLAPLFLAAALAATNGQTNEQRFGFTGPEIFPIDPLVSLIHAADLDGDGKTDVVLVNNARSKINILYNQTGQTNVARRLVVSPRRELNELPPDARFRIDSIASEKRIAALVVADMNGDGRPDLAYYGEPKELVVQYNQGTNGWSTPKRWAIDDGQLGPNALTTGDLNGDKKTDLILLGESHIYLLAQQSDGTLGEPEKVPFSGAVKSAQVLDIDGDGRDDLLLINWDNASPIRFRLQDSTGRLRPEMQFTLPAIRSYIAGDLDKDRKTEVVTIALNSGRAQISGFVQKPAVALSGAFAVGQFEVLPLSRTGKSRRAVTSGDVNGDGLADLLVAEPDSGQLTVCLQQSDGSMGSPKLFPTLTGVSELAVADWDGDGVAEIFLLSADERQIGVSSFDKNGRVAFPTILPLDGKPLAMSVGPLETGAKPSLAVILDQDGKRILVTQTADGKSKSQKLADSFKSNPSSLTIHDLNQDGQPDLVVLIPYE